METIGIIVLLALVFVGVCLVLFKLGKLPTQLNPVATGAQTLITDIETAIAKHKAGK